MFFVSTKIEAVVFIVDQNVWGLRNSTPPVTSEKEYSLEKIVTKNLTKSPINIVIY